MEHILNRRTATILAYTRIHKPGMTPCGLAYAVHFAISRDGRVYESLNQNYGILFAPADITENNTIDTKSLKNPYIFPLIEGGWGIAAIRTQETGEPDSNHRILIWKTKDFMTFTQLDPLSIGNEAAHALHVHIEDDGYSFAWKSDSGCYETLLPTLPGTALEVKPTVWHEEKEAEMLPGLPEDAIPGNSVMINASLADKLTLYWGELSHCATHMPDSVIAHCAKDIESIAAIATYTDGSTAPQQVDWDMSTVDFTKPGDYVVHGVLHGNRYRFPLTHGTGDPVIVPWAGKYYLLFTNDKMNDVEFYAREADSPEELFAPGIENHLILPYDELKGHIQTFWAPEFHIVGGEPYIFFAISGKIWGPQCHVMHLRHGGSFIDQESWEEPKRLVRADGSPLAASGITLDMTVIKAGGHTYAVWSYRNGFNDSFDTGSMLYIAALNEDRPWMLASEPRLLSRPTLSWENTEGTINNEGPHSFVTEDCVYLSYSGGAANSYTYAVGLLTANPQDDLSNPANWHKSLTPVLHYQSVAGEYGPGHNSFFRDDLGNLWIAFHGEVSYENRERCAGIRRVHFDVDGRPRFNLSANRDVNLALRNVSIHVTVK